MRYSSARQQTFDYDAPGASDSDIASAAIPTSIPSNSSSTAYFQLPDFGRYDAVYVATARTAGRINAANISEVEHERLLRERQRLLDKMLDGSITRKEAIKLEYVRWSLDRIEDAQHGQALEMLEGSVSKYEQFLEDLRSLGARLKEQVPAKRRS
jgi:hypothetical protein